MKQPETAEVEIAVRLKVQLVADDDVTADELEAAIKRDLDGIQTELCQKLAFDNSIHSWSVWIDDNRQAYAQDIVDSERITPFEF